MGRCNLLHPDFMFLHSKSPAAYAAGLFMSPEISTLVYIISNPIPFISRNLGNCLSQIRSAVLSGTKVW